MLRDGTIDNLINELIPKGYVPRTEFCFVVEEIRQTLGVRSEEMIRIYAMIALELDDYTPDYRTIKRQHVENRPTTIGVFRAAATTLTRAYKSKDKGPVHPRVSALLRLIAGTGTDKDKYLLAFSPGTEPERFLRSKQAAPEITEETKQTQGTEPEPVQKTKRKSARKPKKSSKPKIDPVPEGFVSSAVFKVRAQGLIKTHQYFAISQLDEGVASTGLCKPGLIRELYKSGNHCPQAVYDALHKFSEIERPDEERLNADLVQPKRYDVPKGKVAAFVFKGLYEQYLEVRKPKKENPWDEIDEDRVKEIEEDLKKSIARLGCCSQKTVDDALQEENHVSEKVYDGIVRLFYRLIMDGQDVMTDEILARFKKPVSYDASGEYHIGQILELKKNLGVVVNKQEYNRMVVCLDTARQATGKLETMILAEGVEPHKIGSERNFNPTEGL
jgi:hypothetical protein